MEELLFEKVYETVCGLRTTDLAEGVEDIFVPGGFCDRRYTQMLGAYERLGTGEEDADVEIVIDAFMDMEREIARQMFRYGMKFAGK